ncbi:MAG: deoxyribonuclease IV [Deltaproteobacteria bacterium]|jgi:deoxyribonuclease-4|nr:deoxyribonuclease IV [Deltaproteobacteria bacterium]
MYLGCHLSVTKGYLALAEEALKLGADTGQFFLRNPRGSRSRPLDPEDAGKFREFVREHGFGPMTAHAPYTLNAASAEERTLELARTIVREDLERLAYFPGVFYNLHPGCHKGLGPEAGMERTAKLLNEVYPEDSQAVILLETMTGKGTELGSTFEELAFLMSRFRFPERIGVCLDTCHVHDAGYGIANDLDGVLEEFDRICGLEKLKAIHLNDSLNPRGSRKDRHAKIGEGIIGLEPLVRVLGHPRLKGLPMILETPNDPAGYAREIALLRKSLETRSANRLSGSEVLLR